MELVSDVIDPFLVHIIPNCVFSPPEADDVKLAQTAYMRHLRI